MKQSAFLRALGLAAAAGCAATGLPSDPVMKDYELHQWVSPLKSGLRVVVQEDPGSDLVVTSSVFSVGGTGDPPGKEGLAHLVEHLAFKSKPGGVQFWDRLKRMGASFNATTNQDFTTYWIIAHKDNVEQMLQLDAWRLARTLEGVTEQEFATEKEVVRNELRLRVENGVFAKMFDLVFAALFPPKHPLARSVIGSHDSLSAATLADARAFVKKNYTPDNCTIVVSGAVETEYVKKQLGRWPAELLFASGGGPQGPDVPPRPRLGQRPVTEPPPPYDTKLVRDKAPISQPQLLIAWSMPGGYRGNDSLYRLVSDRLNIALDFGLDLDLYDDDDIEGVSAFDMPLADASVMLVLANLRPGADPEKARARILDTVSNSWNTEAMGLPTDKVSRLQAESLRWFTSTQLLLMMAQPTFKATQLAEYFGATGKTSFFKNTLEELAGVKGADVTDLAYKWLRRERSVAAYFEPETDQIPKTMAGGAGGGGSSQGARQEHDIGRGGGAASTEYSADAIRRVARPPGLVTLPRFKLPNGLEVVVLQRGTAPVVQVELGFPGGEAHTRPRGLGRLAVGLSRSTCRDHGDLAPVGGFSGGFAGSVESSWTVEVLSGNLANGLAVLSDELACLDVGEEYFLAHERQIERRAKIWQREMKLPEVLASKRFWAELYPDHPFGETFPDPSPLKTVKREDALGFLRSVYRPEKAVMVVAGDAGPAEVRRLVETYVSRWNAGGGSAFGALAPPQPPPARKVVLVDRPGATQAAVDIGCRLADATAVAVPAYHVLERLAGEKAWELREKWGATYGVHPSIGMHPGGATHLTLNGAIENGKVGVGVARLIALLGELGSADEKVTEQAFLVSRWDTAREFATRFATAGGGASAIQMAKLHGWPDDVWDRYPERLAALTRASLKEIARPCVGKEIVVLAGDAKKVRPELEAAGIKLAD